MLKNNERLEILLPTTHTAILSVIQLPIHTAKTSCKTRIYLKMINQAISFIEETFTQVEDLPPRSKDLVLSLLG